MVDDTYSQYVDRLKAAARRGAHVGRGIEDVVSAWRVSFQEEHGVPPNAADEHLFRWSIQAYRQALELLDQSRYH